MWVATYRIGYSLGESKPTRKSILPAVRYANNFTSTYPEWVRLYLPKPSWASKYNAKQQKKMQNIPISDRWQLEFLYPKYDSI
jgi:hypothetical protein